MDFQQPENDLAQKICSHIESKSPDLLTEFLASAASKVTPDFINKKLNSCGMSLLHYSVGHSDNDCRVVKVLLDFGADPNNKNCEDNVSPLHLSVLYEFDAVLEILLKYGGNASLIDGEGNSCFTLAAKQEEADLLKSVLLRHGHSFCSLSSISSSESTTSSSGETASSTNTFFTCESSVTSSSNGNERSGMNFFFTDDEDENLEPRGKRYGQLSTIKEETSSLMKKFSPPPTTPRLCSAPEVVQKEVANEEIKTPNPKSADSMPTLQSSNRLLQLYNNNNNASASKVSSSSSSGSAPPSPTRSEMESLELKMSELKMPVTTTTYRTLAKFWDPSINKMVLNTSENSYSLELQSAIRNMNLIHDYGNLKLDLLHNELESPRASKSFYNYVLLDPKIIKRINFSGHQLKSDVIFDFEKFRKFLSAIFYIGKGSGIRPIQHLVDAKSALTYKQRNPSEKIAKILTIWKSGQGVIVQSFDHHSKEKEANVNEATMIDAMGLKDLSNLRKGSYSGTQASKWTQKQKNQFGAFLLHKCFSLYAVNSGKEFFPHDI